MPIKRTPLLTVAENRQRRGKVPLSPAHELLIEALAAVIVADLE